MYSKAPRTYSSLHRVRVGEIDRGGRVTRFSSDFERKMEVSGNEASLFLCRMVGLNPTILQHTPICI